MQAQHTDIGVKSTNSLAHLVQLGWIASLSLVAMVVGLSLYSALRFHDRVDDIVDSTALSRDQLFTALQSVLPELKRDTNAEEKNGFPNLCPPEGPISGPRVQATNENRPSDADAKDAATVLSTRGTVVSRASKLACWLDKRLPADHKLDDDKLIRVAQDYLVLRDSWDGVFGIHWVPRLTAYLGLLSRHALTQILVLVMGAAGSLIYITRHLLKAAIQGTRMTAEPDRPTSWYVFRPFFGMVVAFTVYLMLKSGQFTLTVVEGDDGGQLNLFAVSLLSFVSGLLSWDALAMIESWGGALFKRYTRRDLWPTGLRHALENEDKTPADLASQVGVSVVQVDRWLTHRDKVRPEMQDRILSWLEVPSAAVFSDKKPLNPVKPRTRPARKLVSVLVQLDVTPKQLAKRLYTDERQVADWCELKETVTPDQQDQIANALGMATSEVFPAQELWGAGLQNALHEVGLDAGKLAHTLGLADSLVTEWVEEKERVPDKKQHWIANYLHIREALLFSEIKSTESSETEPPPRPAEEPDHD